MQITSFYSIRKFRTQHISWIICVWHAGIDLASQQKLQSMCAQEQPLSPDTFHCGITLASDWFEHVITSSESFLPTFYLFRRLFPREGNAGLDLSSSNRSHIFLWYVRLCLMGPGSADGSHWLTGGFDSLTFAEAVNHQLSIATVSHSLGHPFVCSSSVLLWRLMLVVQWRRLRLSRTTVKSPNDLNFSSQLTNSELKVAAETLRGGCILADGMREAPRIYSFKWFSAIWIAVRT